MSQREVVRQLVADYWQARHWDAQVNEADNAGNDAGDKLAKAVAKLLEES